MTDHWCSTRADGPLVVSKSVCLGNIPNNYPDMRAVVTYIFSQVGTVLRVRAPQDSGTFTNTGRARLYIQVFT